MAKIWTHFFGTPPGTPPLQNDSTLAVQFRKKMKCAMKCAIRMNMLKYPTKLGRQKDAMWYSTSTVGEVAVTQMFEAIFGIDAICDIFAVLVTQLLISKLLGVEDPGRILDYMYYAHICTIDLLCRQISIVLKDSTSFAYGLGDL